MVDEFQDVDDYQYEIIKLLTGKKNNLFVVGDPDQTIYTWRGARETYIRDFSNDFSKSKTVIMDQNYRSTQHILNVANQVISTNHNRMKKNLYTNNPEGDKVHITRYDCQEDEAEQVVKQIADLHRKGVEYHRMVVLFRTNAQSLMIEKECVNQKVPYSMMGSLRFFDRMEIKDIIAYLTLLVSEDAKSFYRIINKPLRSIGEVTLNKAAALSSDSDKSFITSLLEVCNDNQLYELSKLLDIVEWGKQNFSFNTSFINEYMNKIGYFTFLKEKYPDDTERWENIQELCKDIEIYIEDNPEAKLIDYLSSVTLYGERGKEQLNQLKMMTVHTAKGLEYEYVFLIGMNKNVFPHYNAKVMNN